MKEYLIIVLVAVGLVFTSSGVSGEELDSNTLNLLKNKDWFLSIEYGRFSDNVAIGFDDIPEQNDFYELKHTLLSGKIGIGVRVSPRTSLALQYAIGPDDHLQLFSYDESPDTFNSVRSHFLSLVMSREFNVNVTDSVDAKFGITRASIENQRRLGQTRYTISRNNEVKPMVALAYRRALSQRWSGVIEVSNYFLSEPDIVTSVTAGFRFDF
ncbi:MAG: hypothetical protein OXG15_01980 [Gammaproteobacteria bacterium]|nr:hypothetical protein [Gammaproteobacteria bacterium]